MDEHPQVDELLNAVIPFAHELLVKEGGFLPFAVTMDGTGELTAKGYELDEEQREPERVLLALADELRRETTETVFSAVALCWDALIQADENDEPRDAVAVAVETAEGRSLEVFVPYTPGVDVEGESTILLGEALAAERNPSLFADDALRAEG